MIKRVFKKGDGFPDLSKKLIYNEGNPIKKAIQGTLIS